MCVHITFQGVNMFKMVSFIVFVFICLGMHRRGIVMVLDSSAHMSSAMDIASSGIGSALTLPVPIHSMDP